MRAITSETNIPSHLLNTLLFLGLIYSANANMPDFKSLEKFSANLFTQIAETNENKNIVFSPFSIQTCVAMARMGATDETAEEIDRGIGLKSNNVTVVAKEFEQILTRYNDGKLLKIANKIYVKKDYKLKKEFNELLSKYFFTSADEIDFTESNKAAKTINTWVESKTENLIKDLVPPSALDGFTRLVLLNAIYFKGDWKTPFQKERTRPEDFYLNESDSVKVPMMYVKANFKYAELPELDATALQMPYKDSDLSMLIILPNSRTGLRDLQQKLKSTSLIDITSKMYHTEVIVKLPKFKAEFDIELSSQFRKLGMSRMFSENAQFFNMLESDEVLQVSKIIHKAFIDVNEEGTVAAAATAAVVRCKRAVMMLNIPEFTAEHPFIYFINSQYETSVADCADDGDNTSQANLMPLFMGTITKLDLNTNTVKHDEF